MKTAIIISVVCICIGLAITICGVLLSGKDLSSLRKLEYTQSTYTASEPVTAFNVSEIEGDVIFTFTDSDAVTVDYMENDLFSRKISVSDGRLVFEVEDNRNWFERLGVFSLGRTKKPIVTISIPKGAYSDLSVSTVSGDIDASQMTTSFSNVTLNSTSGNISFSAVSCANVSVNTTSGDISSSVASAQNVKISTVSGTVSLKDIACNDFKCSGTSGRISLSSVISTGNFKISTVSSSVEVIRSDAENISVNTTSGSVYMSLLTMKDFSHSTVSGRISFPASKDDLQKNGTCKISTVSGNATVELAQ